MGGPDSKIASSSLHLRLMDHIAESIAGSPLGEDSQDLADSFMTAFN